MLISDVNRAILIPLFLAARLSCCGPERSVSCVIFLSGNWMSLGLSRLNTLHRHNMSILFENIDIKC